MIRQLVDRVLAVPANMALWAVLGAYPCAPAAAGSYDTAVQACRAETASRISLSPSDVRIASVGASPKRPERAVVRWQVPEGSQGRCDVLNGSVIAWAMEGKPAAPTNFRVTPEDICVRSVARHFGKRADDVDVIDVERKDRDHAVVHWETYQGDRGICRVAGIEVEKLEFK